MRRIFLKEMHEEYGEFGWKMIGAPSTYTPIGGMGVAHDILEHRANDKGTVEDELLALGAALYIRGEGGWWWRYTWQSDPNPGRNIGSDLLDLGEKYGGFRDGISLFRTTRLESNVEDWIQSALVEGRKELRFSDYYGKDDEPFSKEQEEFFFNARNWLRRGYRMAAKRYAGIDPYRLSTIFAEITTPAETLLKSADDFERLVVDVNVKTNYVRVRLEYQTEDMEE